MRKIILLFVLLSSFQLSFGQELNCIVTVNNDQIRNSNDQVFRTLEKSMSDFMNNTKWTDKRYRKHEKINCALTFIVSEQPTNTSFKGIIQLQVLRPVYNSVYQTPIFNFNDEDVSFNYEEFQPLIFNENDFDSNLTSLLTFYANVILGIDGDTFAYNGGEDYYKKAEKTMLLAQQSGYKGWNRIDGNKTRFQFIDNLLNNLFKDYRFTMYRYHLEGLDLMSSNPTKAKKNMAEAVTNMQRIFLKRPNAFLLRIFLDTKENEIVSVFKDGPRIDTRGLEEMLLKVYPARSSSWNKIQ